MHSSLVNEMIRVLSDSKEYKIWLWTSITLHYFSWNISCGNVKHVFWIMVYSVFLLDALLIHSLYCLLNYGSEALH